MEWHTEVEERTYALNKYKLLPWKGKIIEQYLADMFNLNYILVNSKVCRYNLVICSLSS